MVKKFVRKLTDFIVDNKGRVEGKNAKNAVVLYKRKDIAEPSKPVKMERILSEKEKKELDDKLGKYIKENVSKKKNKIDDLMTGFSNNTESTYTKPSKPKRKKLSDKEKAGIWQETAAEAQDDVSRKESEIRSLRNQRNNERKYREKQKLYDEEDKNALKKALGATAIIGAGGTLLASKTNEDELNDIIRKIKVKQMAGKKLTDAETRLLKVVGG